MTTAISSPTVTSAIPFHSRINLGELQEAVDSMLNQSYPLTELQLIQDGPVSDEIHREVEKLVRTHEIINKIVVPKNLGLAHALNVSILASRGTYYARMDADDISHPERIEKQVDFLEKHQDVDIVGTYGVEFTHRLDEPNSFFKALPCDHKSIRRMFHYRDPVIHVSTVFRRSVFSRLGIYDSEFRCNQDTELWARAFRLGGIQFANIPEALMYIRTTGAVKRRASLSNILTQARGRFRFNTFSPRLNVLKMSALGLRLLPNSIQELAYRRLR